MYTERSPFSKKLTKSDLFDFINNFHSIGEVQRAEVRKEPDLRSGQEAVPSVLSEFVGVNSYSDI